MKTVGLIVQVFIFALVLGATGCEQAQVEEEFAVDLKEDLEDNGFDVSLYARYAPVKIEIMPLTEFTTGPEAKGLSEIKLYVSLLDSTGCQEKSPVVFRFELYERVLRSGESKGKRAVIWPDVDLTEPEENDNYWRDFLRAYEFELDFEPRRNQDYILEVTCLCPHGKRLSADFVLKHTQ
jgi:hypothetical protein